MMKLIGEFGKTGKPDMNVIEENLKWYEFNADADARVMILWSFGKNHLLVKYPKP